MQQIPSRADLAALSEAANAVASAPVSGLARAIDGQTVSLVYSYPYGIGEYRIPTGQLPAALQPTGDEPRDDDAGALAEQPRIAIDFMLAAERAARLVSLPLGAEVEGRFWIAVPESGPLTADQIDRLRPVAAEGARLLTTPQPVEHIHERFARLERAAELVPSLLRVLDIREVFERLSAAAKRALPHDLLLLRVFSEDLAHITVYARSDRGTAPPMVVPNSYPLGVLQAWAFDIVDDFKLHPGERDTPPAKLGARSVVRVPIRFDDHLIGGLGFLSFTPSRFTSEDVEVARRLADHVAVALSHYELANRLADEARRAEGLRVRTMNLELLDELLTTLGDSDALADVFARITAIASKVLPHDAAAMLVRLAGGRRARVYAGPGFPAGSSETIDIPAEMLDDASSDHHISDHGSDVEGYPSQLRVAIRSEGRLAGALLFLSRAPSAFTAGEVLVARRLAERIAITLAHDREVEAVKRADEATARAAKLEARVRMLTDELDARTGYRRVVGESKQWRQVLTQATQVSATETTVLLLGESGTGKEVVARFLHRGSSRSHGPFVALNCAALPEQLLEAELFGYERGAYTGATQSKPGQLEQAAGGTLFLDEVGEMSPSAQAKFLRVLQEREFQRLGGTRVLRTDARVVAATNRDLQRAIANGQFREDLYYRLNVFAIRLPALRERRDDVLALSQAFIAEIGRSIGRPPAGISRDARQMLVDYHWPGNVRELRNILERAAILCDGGLITADHLALGPPPAAAPPVSAHPVPGVPATAQPAAASPASGDLHSMERAMIEQALQNARFNKSKAAQALGITRHQLYIRMRKYGLE
jgi:transcriptional regulator with GAF, ATPase, and Fis domain